MDKNKIKQAATLAGAGLTADAITENKIVVTATIPNGNRVFIKSVDAYGNYDYTKEKSEARRMDANEMTTRVAELQNAAEQLNLDIKYDWMFV